MVCGCIPLKIVRKLLLHDGNQCTGHSHNSGKTPSLIISLLTCFSGGVFLAITFLDLLPDANEALRIVKSFDSWQLDYPIIEAIMLLGFFAVDILEFITHKLGLVHTQTIITRNPTILEVPNLPKQASAGTTYRRSVCEIHGEDGHSVDKLDLDRDSKKDLMKTFSFVFALLIHSALEGFAFGIQPDSVTIISIFIGLFVHKAVVAFSVGMRLTRCHFDKPPAFIIIIICVFALTSPLFSVIGILVESSSLDLLVKNKMSTVLISFSMGTFLYISFYEMLSPERIDKENKFFKILSAFAGVLLIGIVMIFSS
uniref:Zinc transporter ZIP3 n=1 Tax=Rhabditophanes sp. KR3021 TaxID=114890 RepID=A0AC35TR83_9BILA